MHKIQVFLATTLVALKSARMILIHLVTIRTETATFQNNYGKVELHTQRTIHGMHLY